MCRLLGYLGVPTPLGALLSAPPHSLLKQSWLAKELVGATVNADGWGAGLFLAGDPKPCVYTSTQAIWADANSPHLGRALAGRSMVAAVRSATDPLSVSHANTQPFATDGLLFVHNGYVENFRSSVRRKVCDALSDEGFAALSGMTDSEHLFALIVEELQGDRSVEALLRAGSSAIRRMSRWANEAGGRGHFSVVLSTEDSMVAFRSATEPRPPSLYLMPEPGPLAPGTIIASEPLDEDPRWHSIPPEMAVVVRPLQAAEILPIPLSPGIR